MDEEVDLLRDFRDFIEREGGHDYGNSGHNPLSITKEVNLIYELKDVLEELYMLRQLFLTQIEVIEKYHTFSTLDQTTSRVGLLTSTPQSHLKSGSRMLCYCLYSSFILTPSNTHRTAQFVAKAIRARR